MPDPFNWIIEPITHNKKHGLGLGSMFCATNHEQLREAKFGAVVSVMGEAELKLPEEIKHFRIMVGDSPTENIKCFFDSAIKFIAEHIQNTNVLVHCKAGVSRSATVTGAYLMHVNAITANEAIARMQSKRPVVFPNKGFVKQLKGFERELARRRENEFKCICY